MFIYHSLCKSYYELVRKKVYSINTLPYKNATIKTLTYKKTIELNIIDGVFFYKRN